MARILEQAKLSGIATLVPAHAQEHVEKYQQSYDKDRHRIYSLAFWMTDSEMGAEELLANVFRRAFVSSPEPSAEALDRALMIELREFLALGTLTLEQAVCTEVSTVRRNVMRVHLERAVVQLPPTERLIFLLHDVEGYDHVRIGRTIGISEQESQLGLHQARLRMRELVAGMAV